MCGIGVGGETYGGLILTIAKGFNAVPLHKQEEIDL